MDLFETLEQLCAGPAPSGFEDAAAGTALALLKPLADSVSVDRLGSVIGVRRCGKPNAKRLLLDAHLDEVGLIVTGVEEGFLRFSSLGRVDPRVLPDQELTVMTKNGPVLGVVACLPPHVQTGELRNKAVPMEELRIDIGMSQEEAERAVPVGTPIAFRGRFFRLLNHQFCGKSLDDRACFVILLRVAELLRGKDLDVDVYFMGSVREETSGAGAVAGVNAIRPDWCVAVDVTFARTPDLSEDKAPCRLCGGPAIGVGPNMTWALTDLMTDTAKDLGIPYQFEVMERGSGTNGEAMQICLEGIPTSVVSLPLKYMHTPSEVVSLDDMEHTARLLAAFAERLGKEGSGGCF